MSTKFLTVEQIISMLQEGQVALGQGQTVKDIWRKLGIHDTTSYRWRQIYGVLKLDEAKLLKELGRENVRLNRAGADLPLDKLILKEAAETKIPAAS